MDEKHCPLQKFGCAIEILCKFHTVWEIHVLSMDGHSLQGRGREMDSSYIIMGSNGGEEARKL